MTGLKCSIEQRTVGKQRGCNVRVGRATGMGQQAVVIRPGRELSLEAQPIDAATRAGCSAGGARSAARLPDPCQAPRTDHLSGADLVTSWCGQPQHYLTSTRQPVWAHKPLGAVERIRHVPVRTATPESMPMILGRPMTSW
jgi:hypothetical protein